jgi:hypothetical protein
MTGKSPLRKRIEDEAKASLITLDNRITFQCDLIRRDIISGRDPLRKMIENETRASVYKEMEAVGILGTIQAHTIEQQAPRFVADSAVDEDIMQAIYQQAKEEVTRELEWDFKQATREIERTFEQKRNAIYNDGYSDGFRDAQEMQLSNETALAAAARLMSQSSISQTISDRPLGGLMGPPAPRPPQAAAKTAESLAALDVETLMDDVFKSLQ